MTIPMRPATLVKASTVAPPAISPSRRTSYQKKPVAIPSAPITSAIKKSVNTTRGNQHKASWSTEEDATLLRIIEENGGAGRWRLVAERFERETGSIGRRAKHCRERYFNHLDPNINHAEWTHEEHAIMLEAYAKYGKAWSKISKLLPGRTDNAIKNRWYCQERKQSRKSRAQSNNSVGISSDESTDDSGPSPRTRKRSLDKAPTVQPNIQPPAHLKRLSIDDTDQESDVAPMTKRLSIDETDADESLVNAKPANASRTLSLPRLDSFLLSPPRLDSFYVPPKSQDLPVSSPSLPRCEAILMPNAPVRPQQSRSDSRPTPSTASRSSTSSQMGPSLHRFDSMLFASPPAVHNNQPALVRPDSFLNSIKTPGGSFYYTKTSSTVESQPAICRPPSLCSMLAPTISSYDLHLLLDTITFNL